jgi:predicted unusual protein kinase regulating ubiquinone biosynthesis (AarF/ABC1/UbiB family)
MAGERRRGLVRAARLASLPMSIMTQRMTALGKQIVRGAEQGQVDAELVDKAAEQVFHVLGELKGGAMKLGQALSVAEAAVPPKFAERYRDALVRLQSQAPPMPTASVHRMLEQQLGTRWRGRFRSFDDTPIGAASIGQVHRAVWADGRDVAVKVQYPGADQSLMADLKVLQMFAGAFGMFLPGTDVRAILADLVDRTVDELDYRIESNYQRIFAESLGPDHPKFFVSKVIASAPKVMVTEWMDGEPLSRVIADGAVAQRHNAGMLLAEFALSSPPQVGYLHCDPHPGNFKLLADGRLGVLDFGACLPLPHGVPAFIGEMSRVAVDQDYDTLIALMREHGFIKSGAPFDPEGLKWLIHPVVAELRGDTLHLSRAFMQAHMMRMFDFKQLSLTNAAAARTPSKPPELIMIGRVLSGVVGICAQLDVEGPFLSLVEQYLPGFARE